MPRSAGKKAIEIREETYIRLKRRKIQNRESFDSVVNRILDGDIHEQPR